MIRRNLKWYFLGAIFLANVFIWSVVYSEDGRGLLRVSFLDIGQGDAIFIRAPNGNQVLLDGGPNSKVLSELGKVMPFYDRSIDMIIVSNPDADHITGLVKSLEKYKISYNLEPGTVAATAVYAALEKDVADNGVKKLIARTGETVILDKKKNVQLTVLFPDRDVSTLTTNDGSLVAKLSYGKTCFILTGDAPQGVENYLVRLYGGSLKCDVLKIGHHGSKTSSSPEFVAAVAPEYAVISVGKNNKYGHPNKETLDTLNAFGSKILRTDETGTISFVSDGKSVKIK